jgi:5-methylcytosine-specific restriction protein B
MSIIALNELKKNLSQDELWKSVTNYAVLDSSGKEKEELADKISKLVGIEKNKLKIYVAKLTQNGLYNQVWQGKAISNQNDIFVFLDQTSNRSTVLKAMQDRLSPRPDNGFEAIVIGNTVDQGWEVSAVVEYDGSEVGASLQKLLGIPLNIIKVKDPAIIDGINDTVSLLDSSTIDAYVDDDDEISANEIIQHLVEAKNVVLEGPPGTGKTRLALQVITELGNGESESFRLESILNGRAVEECIDELNAAPVVWEIIQLHPGFGYDEFVRGIRTDPNNPGFSLCSVDGILPQMSTVAEIRNGKPTLLLIDEINRGNLSAILGETIFAIDPAHRGIEIRLQHPAPRGGKESLTVPTNLFLLATMNSADRSVAMLDFAVRRRFRFVRVEPSRGAIERFYSGSLYRARATMVLFETFSSAIAQTELRPGHSYFLVADQEKLTDIGWAQQLTARVLYELRPLFDEYRSEGIELKPVTVGNSLDLLAIGLSEVSEIVMTWLVSESGI